MPAPIRMSRPAPTRSLLKLRRGFIEAFFEEQRY
jgi:hypothetical protein